MTDDFVEIGDLIVSRSRIAAIRIFKREDDAAGFDADVYLTSYHQLLAVDVDAKAVRKNILTDPAPCGREPTLTIDWR